MKFGSNAYYLCNSAEPVERQKSHGYHQAGSQKTLPSIRLSKPTEWRKAQMKNSVKILAGKLAKVTAVQALKRDANSTTCIAVFQPKVPAKLAKFKSVTK